LRFGLVAALALPGILFALRLAPQSGWVLCAVLLHMLSLLSVFVTERYRLAAVPGVLLFASCGLVELWRSCVRANYVRVGIYLALLAPATLFVTIAKKDPALWALDPYNSGWQALDSKNFALAKEKLELAYAYVPQNAEINFALGNLQLEQGDKTGAKAWYRETLKIDRTHEGSWNNLGVLALEEQRWSLAIQFFQTALRLSPNDAKTHYLLARAFHGSGDIAQARDHLETALRLRPGQAEFVELRDRLQEHQ
jgi:Tfp pilus assembly protein PilF